MNHGALSSFGNYDTRTIHRNPTSFLTEDSPQPLHAHVSRTNFYDPVRDVYHPSHHPGNNEFRDFDGSSTIHSVQSPTHEQSLVPDAMIGGSTEDSASLSLASAHTTSVTLGDTLHLSASSGHSEPSSPYLATQSDAPPPSISNAHSIVETDIVETESPVGPDLTDAQLQDKSRPDSPLTPSPDSPINVHSIVETDSPVGPDPTDVQLQDKSRPDSPLTPSPTPISTRPFSPLASASKYHPSTHPVGPHYCPEIVFEPMDLSAEVLGSGVGDQAEIQVWPNGWKTVLPELRNETHSGNILEAVSAPNAGEPVLMIFLGCQGGEVDGKSRKRCTTRAIYCSLS